MSIQYIFDRKMAIYLKYLNFDALRSLKALFFLTNFQGPTFIPCPMYILGSRVKGMAEGLKIQKK